MYKQSSIPMPERRSPRWYGVPVRVILITLIGTLLVFAVSLLLAIVGTEIASALRGIRPDMRLAYRVIALPITIAAATVIFITSAVIEIKLYLKTRQLES